MVDRGRVAARARQRGGNTALAVRSPAPLSRPTARERQLAAELAATRRRLEAVVAARPPASPAARPPAKRPRPRPTARPRPPRPRRPPRRIRLGRSNPRRDQATAGVVALLVVFLLAQTRDDTAPAAAAAVDAPPIAEAPAAPATPDTAVLAAPGGSGCTVDDPTSDDDRGCITPVTAHALSEIDRVMGGYRAGSLIRSTGCWDEHAWNPSSDHPRGKGCDLFPGKFGEFASGDALDHGWQLANWFRDNAEALQVRYVIWQGRIWTAGKPDDGGWGRRYTGGGVYDPGDATGGHFDHVHVSFSR